MLFTIVFGALYYVGTRDYLPKGRRVFENLIKEEVTPEKPLELYWPARRTGVAAPAMNLTIPSYAFGPAVESTQVPRLTTGHGLLYLFASLPDADGLSAQSLGDWCPGGLESPGCHVAVLRLTLMQEEPDHTDEGAMVMTSAARGLGNAFTSGPIRRLNAFWVKEVRDTSRIEFVGWDCEDEPRTGVVTTDVAKPLLERNACFEPPTKEERRAPKLHGYQRLVQLTACAGDGRECKIYFPFRGRYVAVEPMQSPVTFNAEQATGYVFLAAWEFVNRLRSDSLSPPSADARLARAKRALDNCRAIHERLPVPTRENFNHRNELLSYAEGQCGYAAYVAASTLLQRPGEGNAVLQQSLSLTPLGSSAAEKRLRQVGLDAARKAGVPDTADTAQAQFILALRMPAGAPRTPEFEARRAALGEALRLAEATLPAGSETQIQLYQQLARAHELAEDVDGRIAMLERWRASVRNARGSSGNPLRAPTYQLCSALEQSKRLEPLKRCADDYLALWLEGVAASPGGQVPETWVRSGVDLLGWYGACADTADRAVEVLPSMQKVAGIIKPSMHAEAWATYGEPPMKSVQQRTSRSNR